jgi:hypothetical protein
MIPGPSLQRKSEPIIIHGARRFRKLGEKEKLKAVSFTHGRSAQG